jgi:tetratricopeptide (TPR) repeat protein
LNSYLLFGDFVKYEEFVKELGAKKRSISDLIRFVATRTDNNPNYTLLLGAGCSISSGVRSASALADLWRTELYQSFVDGFSDEIPSVEDIRKYLQQHHGGWYDPSREYSSLFEKRYDLQRQRRMFVEAEVSSKIPSIGYAYLTALVVQNYFNTIFTTNFDDLLNEAFYVYSNQRPIVCAHDSSINSVTVTSKRPKIIKLHGDYLFDDLKSTNRETESLEQNIRSKFSEFAKEYGLIVFGYSGGDRSIMDVLSSLLKNEEYLKGGIYWCVRKDSEISEELRKLVWRERVYFVEVEGFDEAFARIFSALNKGEVLPPALVSSARRPVDVSTNLLASANGFSTTCDVLVKAKERLERHSKRTALVNLLVNPDGEDGSKPIGDASLNDDELYLLTEIQNLISGENYKKAIERARQSLRDSVSISLRVRLLRLVVRAHRLLDESAEALGVIDELIRLQPKRVAHHLLRASVLPKWSEKISCIDDAINLDPFMVQSYSDKATELLARASSEYGEVKSDLVKLASIAINKGVELDPSWRNTCWKTKFHIIELQEKDPLKRKAARTDLIRILEIQNPLSSRVLNFRVLQLEGDESVEIVDKILDDADEAIQRTGSESESVFVRIRLKALLKAKDSERLKLELDRCMKSSDLLKDEELVLVMASVLRDRFGKDEEAIELLSSSLKSNFDGEILGALVRALSNLKKSDAASAALKKWGHYLTDSFRNQLMLEVLEAKGDYAAAILELEKNARQSEYAVGQHKLYLLLKMEDWKAAEEYARSLLEPINFSTEAIAEIVNFELARSKNGRKVDLNRLDAVERACSSDESRAAIAMLKGKVADAMALVRKAVDADKTFRHRAADWPVFAEIRGRDDFLSAIKI